MAKTVDERIAAAMKDGARVADIQILIAEMEGEVAENDAEAERQEALSIAVDVSEPDAEAAADDAAKRRRRSIRLTAKVVALKDRVTELENSARRQRATAAHAAMKERRDQLVKDLREQWPDLTARMIDLAKRIVESDAECAKSMGYGLPLLESAESIARGCPASFYSGIGNIRRLTATRLEAFDPSDEHDRFHGVWPPRSDA